MKTVHRKNNDVTPEKKKSSFWEFVGGEFLLKKSVIIWYPYVLLLFLLSVILILNEKQIVRKIGEIDELAKKNQSTILHIKETKRIFPYDADPELIEQIQKEGFIKNDLSVYKITILESEITNPQK